MGNTIIQTAAKTRILLTSLSPLKVFEAQREVASGRFYQQLVLGLTERLSKAEARETAVQLVAVADHAYALRQMDIVEEAGQILMNLPLKGGCSHVGAYYLALSAGRKGNYAEARALLGPVADRAPLSFRTKAMIAFGGYSLAEGESRSAVPFYIEAARTTKHSAEFDPIVALRISRIASILKAEDGDHKRALDDLEKILPLARGVGRHYPSLFSDYLNSYAVELAAVGRLEEAGNVSRIVLASPYASAYPEWRETADDIAGRGLRPPRSLVGFCQTASRADNLLRFSDFERNEDSPPLEPRLGLQPAQVVNIDKWKKTHMPRESSKTPELTEERIAAMTPGQRRSAIAELIWGDELSEQALHTILTFIEYTIRQDRAKS